MSSRNVLMQVTGSKGAAPLSERDQQTRALDSGLPPKVALGAHVAEARVHDVT